MVGGRVFGEDGQGLTFKSFIQQQLNHGFGDASAAFLNVFLFDFSLVSRYIFLVPIHKMRRPNMKKSVSFLFLSLVLSCVLSSQEIREAVWAGQFYDKDPDSLSRHIDYLLQQAKESPDFSGKILALIAPHAGYVYSGKVAAAAYKLVLGQEYETVIILGPSHYYPLRGCSIYLRGGYRTPLGLASIDQELAAALTKASGYTYIPEAHKREHSIEVQIPFIQKTLPKAKIVPIVMGFPIQESVQSLTNAFDKVLPGRKVLIVSSTDLSHFLPKKEANETDAQTISLIQNFKTHTLLRKCERGDNLMCGGGPVLASLLFGKKQGEAKVQILDYADSSDSEYKSPEDRVVGYLAAALYLEIAPEKFDLSPAEKKELLNIASSTIEAYVLEKRILDYQPQSTILLTKKGAFVTLKKEGNLRGCIGFIQPALPLYQTVIQAAIYAACRDQRFPPLSADELQMIEIEISVLTPLKKIDNPSQVKVGTHGLLISKGNQSGLLLPQVPVENNWSRETFLKQACLKAGLPQDAWRRGADLYVFEAIVFH